MRLPLDLRDQLLDIVQTPARLQPQLAGVSMIRSGSRRFLCRLQTGAKRLIYNLPEGAMQSFCQRSRPIQNIVFQGQCRSHADTVASHDMMSRHHFDRHHFDRRTVAFTFGAACDVSWMV